MSRVKYPLTDETKNLAKELVTKWNLGIIDQTFNYVSESENDIWYWYVFDLDGKHRYSSFQELDIFGLIKIQDGAPILLQELRNAVQNDFAVSDYYLTMNAVGTIIYGDANISAPFQSNAAINSQVSQTQEVTQADIAEKLLEGLGEAFLKANEPIADAIKSLKDEPEKSFKQKLGSVISELGNSMQHGANAYVVMQAIATIAPYLQHM